MDINLVSSRFNFYLPARGGPAVMGKDAIPRRHPIPWAAPAGPSKSKAIGPMRQIKQPSEMPITKVRKINTPKWLANGMQAVAIPSRRKEVCCILMRLMLGRSATLPKMSREIPEVAPIHITRTSPFASGKTSFECLTWRKRIFWWAGK